METVGVDFAAHKVTLGEHEVHLGLWCVQQSATQSLPLHWPGFHIIGLWDLLSV